MTREDLKDIFQAPFSYTNWSNILAYLFTGIGKNCQLTVETSPVAMNNVDDSTMDGYYLGEVSFGLQKLKLYAFHVKDTTTNIKRNRVGLRNTVNYIKDYDDAAIVVYYNDTQWRVSYIRDIITAPKRYTYVFGESHNRYTTPISRFELLTKGDINFDTIYKVFEVEALGDDFFNGYKRRYKSLCDSKQLTTKSQRDYVKKMMGRLVFLQFLQKKGWMCGNYNYLQDLYKNSEYQDDFLEKVLEPLFFGVLNTKECDRDAESLKVLGEIDIPYLNGGLFERDTEDIKYYRFDKSHFEGLFEFFSNYNFTIDENDPNDAEVGIDPEMLGHIFENLLEDNNDKGAFYTPKEIVQYMSRESLIQYLKTHADEALHSAIERLVNEGKVDDILQNKENATKINDHICSVKICDPAIGSGAFPMGLLNELFHCRQLLNGFTQTKADFIHSEVKREIIQNNIYGVDIEQGAVDIARLRFWLALVVDETEKRALPNLDYKIVCGNSLLNRYALDMSIDSAFAEYNKGKSDEEKITLAKLKQYDEEYTNQSDKSEKSRLRSIIEDVKSSFRVILSGKSLGKIPPKYQKIIDKFDFILNRSGNLFDITYDERELSANDKEQLDKVRKLIQDKKDEVTSVKYNKLYADAFEWRFEFPALLDDQGNFIGFDIVIGNPPYIQLQNNGGALANQFKDAAYQTFARTGDIYSLFYERGWQLLSTDGVLCYITSNKWMRAGYGEKTRAFFTSKTNPLLLVDFAGTKVFESATVDTNILLFANSKNNGVTKCAIVNSKSGIDKLSDYIQHNNSVCEFRGGDSWVILSPIERSIKRKIEAVGTPLKDWDIQINYGIKTGCNEAFIISGAKRDEILANCQSEEERVKTAELIRPILRGRDIKRYSAEFADLWLINTHNGVRGKFPRIDINDYPAVKTHLDLYWK